MKMVCVYSWSPKSGSNFGDVIGPMITQKLIDWNRWNLRVQPVTSGRGKLLSVGSIIHSADQGDLIWGSGVNGKNWVPAKIGTLGLTAFAVRGPISRAALLSVGVDTPEVYGDPGLLFSQLFYEDIMRTAQKVRRFYEEHRGGIPETVFIPNLNDERFYLPEAQQIPPHWEIINTGSSPITVAAQIMLAKRVVSSSLHGLVFGDSLGKECVYVGSRFEPTLKYDDYYLGTGRGILTPVSEISDDVESNVPAYRHDVGPLVAAFPEELLRIAVDAPEMDKTPPSIPQPPQKVDYLRDYIADTPTTIVFDMASLMEQKGWINPDLSNRSGYAWVEQVGYLMIDRALATKLDCISIYFNKIAENVKPEKVRATIDNKPAKCVFRVKGDTRYFQISLSNQNPDSSKPCQIKINFGASQDPLQAFQNRNFPTAQVSVQVRKVGATFLKS